VIKGIFLLFLLFYQFFLFYVYIFLVLLIGKIFKHIFIYIKLKKNFKFAHARKYKAIKFKFCCEHNVNMN